MKQNSHTWLFSLFASAVIIGGVVLVSPAVSYAQEAEKDGQAEVVEDAAIIPQTDVSVAVPAEGAPVTAKYIPGLKPASYIGDMKVYVTAYEDTLLDIARRFDLGFVEIQAANPNLDPWVPGENEKVIIPSMHLLPDAPHEGIVVNLGDMRIYRFDEKGRAVKSYPIGVGRDGMKTPLGTSSVVNKKEGPWWYPTQRMKNEDPSLPDVIKQSPQNPLGTHALYLGWPTYAIHGTNEPWGIGRRVSSGCMRMYPEDIPVLYNEVAIGTPVTIVDQVIKIGWVEGDLYLEAHPTKDQATALEYEEAMPLDIPNGLIEMVEKKAGDHKARVDWARVRMAVAERRGFPVKVTSAQLAQNTSALSDEPVATTKEDGANEDKTTPAKKRVTPQYN